MNSITKFYLVSYNFASVIFWVAYLLCFFSSGFQMQYACLLLLNIAQGLAVLDILHVGLKWVKSPMASALVQVLSRLLCLILIDIVITQQATFFTFRWGLILISIAWGFTEVVRYSLYGLQLLGKQPTLLLWLRYSLFLLLYPLGVTGEWLVLLAPVVENGITLGAYTFFLVMSCCAYLYYFPILFKYMWKQRKLKIQ